MKPQIALRKALDDPFLLGSVLVGDSWRSWKVLLIAAMGEQLTDAERIIFKQLTGRDREPLKRVEEFVAVVGRRGGKSRAMATLACYIAALCNHKLVRGERGVLLLCAPDQRQASIALGYAEAALDGSPILCQLIANRSSDTLSLTNGINLEVRASSFRRLRGPTYIGIIADEAAYYYSDESNVNVDTELLAAVRPGLATAGGPLILASSPYAKRGVIWESFKRHYGNQGDPLVLVAQGTSRDFNPSLSQSIIDRALERDHAAASAEYLAEFRNDIQGYVSFEVVSACTSTGVRERLPLPDIQYMAFTDPSGGSADSFTIAIGHRQAGHDQESSLAIVDAIREIRPPFSPDAVCAEYAMLLKQYRISKVIGDKYAGIFPVEAFAKHGIEYEQSAEPKSNLYVNLLPLLNSRQIDLLDHPRAISQICALERRTSRAGKDSIDHPAQAGARDDLANAIAGLASLLAASATDYIHDMSWVGGLDAFNTEWANRQYAQFVMTGGGRRPW